MTNLFELDWDSLEHLIEKETACRYCGKTFAKTDDLIDHIGKKHVWLQWGRHKDGNPTQTVNSRA